jgi:DNA-binding HxlR family transcriptional regulator
MITRSAATTVPAEECIAADESLMRAFDLLGKRWTGVLLGTLISGPVGFRALARAVPGISDSVLSERLAELTEAGLVDRNVAEGPPVSVTYTLTEAGRALLPALEQIRRWAERHLATPGAATSTRPQPTSRPISRRTRRRAS